MNTPTIASLSNRADWTGTINVMENGEQVDTSEATDLIIENDNDVCDQSFNFSAPELKIVEAAVGLPLT